MNDHQQHGLDARASRSARSAAAPPGRRTTFQTATPSTTVVKMTTQPVALRPHHTSRSVQDQLSRQHSPAEHADRRADERA